MAHHIPQFRPYRLEVKTLQPQSRQTSARRGYGYGWQKSRIEYLKENPLCVTCHQNGRIVSATVVDHVIPHKGNMQLFWDHANWQALCKPCHSRKTAAQDGGFGNPDKTKR